PGMSKSEKRCWMSRRRQTYPVQLRKQLYLRGLVLPFIVGSATCAVDAAPKVTLVAAPGSPLPLSATCVAIADLNRDGHQDLLLTVDTHLQTCFGDGSGKFRSTSDRDLNMGERASEMAIGDVNGDGKLDVVTAD